MNGIREDRPGFTDLDLDLESTAELPALEEFAPGQSIDATQSMAALRIAGDGGAPSSPRRPPLEAELHSLGASLADLQRRLDERGERLNLLQVELATAQGAAARAGALQVELTGARTANTLYEVRVRELQERISERDDSLRQAGEREAALRLDGSGQQAVNARLQQDFEQLRARCAMQLEALQSLEVRRGIFEVQLSDLRGRRDDEAATQARENEELRATVRALTEQAAAHAAQAGHLQQEAASRLQAQAESQHAEADAHRALEHDHTQLQQQYAAAQTELQRLRQQSDEQAMAMQEVAAQHAHRLAQITVAEAQVRELTARLQQREHDAGEMARTADDLRSQLEEANRSLKQRDSLMRRLEAEAVHNQALVDNIRHSIQQLTPGTDSEAHPAEPASTRLLVREENGQEVTQVLGRRTTVGRTSDNDLQIDVSYISRHHAIIMTSATQTVIEDLGSTNGVHVNGHRITRQLLTDGDAVLIGRMLFRYVVRPVAGLLDTP